MVKIACKECGKMIDERGMGGHLFGVHMIRTGLKARLADHAKLVDERFDLVKRINTATHTMADHTWHAQEDVDVVNQVLRVLRGS